MRATNSAAVRFSGVTKSFPGYTAVQGINLEVKAGSFRSVVGPSGCGKSTFLNMAIGLMEPTEGAVEIFGEPLRGINRQAGYMFQQDALLPWKTVLDNILLGLELRGIDSNRAGQSAQTWIKRVKRVGLDGPIVDPAIVFIVFMDEPFSALDVHTRLANGRRTFKAVGRHEQDPHVCNARSRRGDRVVG